MPPKNSRDRVVNFRLTDAEFESIVFACHAEGVRTVSEFARDIVLSRARGETTDRLQVNQWLVALSNDFAKIKADIVQVLGILGAASEKSALAMPSEIKSSKYLFESSGK